MHRTPAARMRQLDNGGSTCGQGAVQPAPIRMVLPTEAHCLPPCLRAVGLTSCHDKPHRTAGGTAGEGVARLVGNLDDCRGFLAFFPAQKTPHTGHTRKKSWGRGSLETVVLRRRGVREVAAQTILPATRGRSSQESAHGILPGGVVTVGTGLGDLDPRIRMSGRTVAIRAPQALTAARCMATQAPGRHSLPSPLRQEVATRGCAGHARPGKGIYDRLMTLRAGPPPPIYRWVGPHSGPFEVLLRRKPGLPSLPRDRQNGPTQQEPGCDLVRRHS